MLVTYLLSILLDFAGIYFAYVSIILFRLMFSRNTVYKNFKYLKNSKNKFQNVAALAIAFTGMFMFYQIFFLMFSDFIFYAYHEPYPGSKLTYPIIAGTLIVAFILGMMTNIENIHDVSVFTARGSSKSWPRGIGLDFIAEKGSKEEKINKILSLFLVISIFVILLPFGKAFAR